MKKKKWIKKKKKKEKKFEVKNEVIFLTGGQDKIIRFWRLKAEDLIGDYQERAECVGTLSIDGHTDGVKCFVQWQEMLWSGGKDGNVCVWQVTKNLTSANFSGNCIKKILIEKESWIYCLVVWDDLLYVGSQEKEIIVINSKYEKISKIKTGEKDGNFSMKIWRNLLWVSGQSITIYEQQKQNQKQKQNSNHLQYAKIYSFVDDEAPGLVRSFVFWHGLLVSAGKIGSFKDLKNVEQDKIKIINPFNGIVVGRYEEEGYGTIYGIKIYKKKDWLVVGGGYQAYRRGVKYQGRVSSWKVKCDF